MEETKEYTPEGHLKVRNHLSYEGKKSFTGSVIDEEGIICFYKEGRQHRDDGPSFINTLGNKSWIKEAWYQDGKLHRLDGPARIEMLEEYDDGYYIDGVFYSSKEVWEAKIKELGLLSPNKEPVPESKYTPEGHLKVKGEYPSEMPDGYTGSIIDKNGIIVYYQNGKISRDDGPAFLNPNKIPGYIQEGWLKDGLYHRLDGIAVVWQDGSKHYSYQGRFFQKEERDEWINACGHTKVKYLSDKLFDKNFTGSAITETDELGIFKNGNFHNEDGPAWFREDGVFYCRNGSYHRTDGPAKIYKNGNVEYWLDDQRYDSKEEWEKARDKYLRIEKVLKHYGLDKVVKVKDVVETKHPNFAPQGKFTGVTISENDIVVFWKNGNQHRDNDEFCFYNDFDHTYIKRTKRVNGRLHSTTGYAWIDRDSKNNQYHLNGRLLSKEAWEAEVKKMNEEDFEKKNREHVRKILDGNGLQNIDVDDLRIVTAKHWNEPLNVNDKFTGIVVDTEDEIVVFYENGKQHREDGPSFLNLIKNDRNCLNKLCYRINGKRHRLDGPAIVSKSGELYWIEGEYYTKEDFNKKVQGLKTREILDKYGLQDIKVEDVTLVDNWRHIPTGFTGIVLDKNDMVVFYKEGRKHRENGPCFFNNKPKQNGYIQRAWRLDDKLHRTDGPAWVEDFEKPELDRYYLNGIQMSKADWEVKVKVFGKKETESTTMVTDNNDDKYTAEGHLKVERWDSFLGKSDFSGSVIDNNGLICYYKNGKEHREDGPSFINSKNIPTYLKECWCQNGRYHREDGPAWTGSDGEEHYYLYGLSFPSKEAWEKELRERGLGKYKLVPQPEQKPSNKKINVSTEAEETAYRLARNEILKLVRKMLTVQMIGKSKSKSVASSVQEFLSSELGASLVLGSVGILLPKLEDKLPKKYKRHLERLNKEFRVAGMTSIGNNAVELLTDSVFLSKTTKVLEAIPTSVVVTTEEAAPPKEITLTNTTVMNYKF